MRGENEIQNQKMESKAEIRASIKSAAYLENKKDTRGIRHVVWVGAQERGILKVVCLDDLWRERRRGSGGEWTRSSRPRWAMVASCVCCCKLTERTRLLLLSLFICTFILIPYLFNLYHRVENFWICFSCPLMPVIFTPPSWVFLFFYSISPPTMQQLHGSPNFFLFCFIQ